MFRSKLQLYISKTIAILLIGYGIYSLYSSLHLILVQIPFLEKQLATSSVSTQQINNLATEAIFQLINTVLSFIFAAKLAVSHPKILDIFLSIITIVGSFALQQYVISVGGISIIKNASLFLFNK